MFLKRLLRSSGGTLGNEKLFLEAGTSPGLALLGTVIQGLSEGTESYIPKDWGSRWMGFIWERSKNEVT